MLANLRTNVRALIFFRTPIGSSNAFSAGRRSEKAFRCDVRSELRPSGLSSRRGSSRRTAARVAEA
ncbi:hypothetical protein HMPREF9440_01586 [Sutterella parvirubra YIT 11816]|uniref:Uncharacterized protein n=1 Tax=Sutterella parvirubra YIT 11816 TaxID=762967 RepID=H3KFR7_9BURK|nr:hypothetical protein HMPREF9440_01586 [Sutterella parvirubra YIT 11816]